MEFIDFLAGYIGLHVGGTHRECVICISASQDPPTRLSTQIHFVPAKVLSILMSASMNISMCDSCLYHSGFAKIWHSFVTYETVSLSLVIFDRLR